MCNQSVKKQTKQKAQNLTKRTSATPNSFDKEHPIWSFDNVDKDGLFKFDPKRTDFDHKDFLEKILVYSTMTWGEIKKQTHDNGKSKRLCQRFCVNSKPPKNANFW